MTSWLLKIKQHSLSVQLNDAAVAGDKATVKRVGEERRQLKYPLQEAERIEAQEANQREQQARWITSERRAAGWTQSRSRFEAINNP
jgi:hypothetical protein